MEVHYNGNKFIKMFICGNISLDIQNVHMRKYTIGYSISSREEIYHWIFKMFIWESISLDIQKVHICKYIVGYSKGKYSFRGHVVIFGPRTCFKVCCYLFQICNAVINILFYLRCRYNSGLYVLKEH